MTEEERRKGRADSFSEFINTLSCESDRGSVIVSAALFDDILLKLLKQRLAPSLEKKDELFESGQSPFSTFSSKIDIAYRIGLIRPSVRATLHLIRRTRNDFAHVSENTTFETSSIKHRVEEIFKLNQDIIDTFSEALREDLPQSEGQQGFIEIIGPRKAYELLLAGSAAFLLDSVHDVEPILSLE